MLYPVLTERRYFFVLFRVSTLLLILVSCHQDGSTGPPNGQELTVLLMNDVYRINGTENGAAGGLARVRTLRIALEKDAPNTLVLHAGDLLFPSMLSRRYQGQQMIDILNLLDGNAAGFDENFYATFGNHEFDKPRLKHAAMLNQRIEESRFTWLTSNISFSTGLDGRPLINAEHLKNYDLIQRNGIRIGLFSVTTDVVFPDYVSAIKDPIETARSMTAMLRAKGADLVIALTHLTLKQDMNILDSLGAAGPDIIFGGHEHIKLVGNSNGRYVFKADADARSALVARIRVNPGTVPDVTYKYHELDQSVVTDTVVQKQVDRWLVRYDREFCKAQNVQPGCLSKPLGKTAVKLVGEEMQIRSVETNLGDWVADQALDTFHDHGAQIAFLNSGGLRLNQNLPRNSPITGQTLFELFAYPTPLYTIRIDGATLQRVIEHSITGWPGQGRWLQIAGFAWRHHSIEGTVDGLTLLTENGPRPIRPDDTLLAVVSNYLIDPAIGDQDGYTMLELSQVVALPGEASELARIVADTLLLADDAGIAPEVEGRICSMPQRPDQPCLAVLPSK